MGRTFMNNANAAILFEADGYLLDGEKLMGRQSAGNGFLRAAIAGRNQQTLHAYTPYEKSARIFNKVVKTQDNQAQTAWIPSDRLDLLTQVGALYLAGPGLGSYAKLRQRVGANAYSLIGVTHTIASHNAMDAITQLLSAPVMPWDALICTSSAALESIKTMLHAEIEYLRWRFGAKIPLVLPQLPIIPLGVHCKDFEFSPVQRQTMRAELNIADDEIVVLFFGRLSFHAKAHPHAMYLGLQTVAEKTGKKITLLQCGCFPNDAVEKCFVEGAKQFCPDVRAVFVHGRSENANLSWATADIFVSLSDNIQETFGITPLEAMAAGLPVVVSDWDGYKDTVRDGIDGFRIPTWMPPANLGENFAKAHEANADSYDIYCGLNCQTVSMDISILVERLSDLVLQPDLRQKMGQAGFERARNMFDWSIVYKQYQKLYQELAQIRQNAQKLELWKTAIETLPRVNAGRLDPYKTFANYPTQLIQPQTRVFLNENTTLQNYQLLIQHGFFNYASKILPRVEIVEKMINTLKNQSQTAEELSQLISFPLGDLILNLSVLAKMGFLKLK